MRNAGYRKPFLNVPTLVTSASCGAQIAFSRVQLNWAGRTLDDNPTEDAYSFFINFLQQASSSVSWRGHTTERYWFDVGNSALLDYKQVLKTTLHSPVDAVRLYVPRLAEERNFGYARRSYPQFSSILRINQFCRTDISLSPWSVQNNGQD